MVAPPAKDVLKPLWYNNSHSGVVPGKKISISGIHAQMMQNRVKKRALGKLRENACAHIAPDAKWVTGSIICSYVA